MRSITYIIFIFILILLLGLGIIILINTEIFSTTKDAHPPCDQLPDLEEVNKAINIHQEFVKKLESLGDHITVKAENPCVNDQNRGLILINYQNKDEREKIINLINQNEGLGVPLYLERN